MRGRKLLDQTLPLKAAGTLVSLLEQFLSPYYFAIPKSRSVQVYSSSTPSLSILFLATSLFEFGSNITVENFHTLTYRLMHPASAGFNQAVGPFAIFS